MASDHETGTLDHIAVERIDSNPENPRLNFRQGELEELQESIRQYGVQVPIAVYKKGRRYVLIDGERRWRCSSKLNLKTIPALIQEEPAPLQNLLLMFNIHALREQWDLLTIALKLPTIISLLEDERGKSPTETELSTTTGLSRSVIRRCRLLTDLPKKYQNQLLGELKKPKSKQALSEDFFIEMEKSLKTVMRAMPGVVSDKNRARDCLLKKYKDKVIDNIVDFRKMAKIARAKSVDADADAARTAIQRLLDDPDYSIDEAWNDTVAEAYVERDIVSRIEHLLSKLGEVGRTEIDEDVRDKLEELVQRARAILEADE
ncbi:ParB/RepB/Spo0J family partition protein [Lacipirellula parvula]|uniref:ParB n=1 Tax=Lacipirellula parvula TaxID=2650471 RepID=A0A5K7X4N2_9BACT|nr:ParB/RepB/Spo0J family partition protein [Lacipirellula parvula]BBO30727.1 parB [Lacipirellula parvula]